MFNRRINKLRTILKEKNINALLITNFYNILYLTGFKTLTENEREAFVIVTKNKTYLLTDERYINNDKLQMTNDNSISNNKDLIIKLITPERKLIQNLQEIIRKEKIKNLAVESEDIKLSEHELLKNKLEVQIIPTSQLIIRLRELKEDEEIIKIKKACEIGDQCLEEIVKNIKVGQTEKEIAWKIESWTRSKGYEIAFDPIVALDKNSAVPHYQTKDGLSRVRRGSIILVDFGVKYKNYCSDITRMIFIGQPKQEQINIYNNLLTVQQSTIDHLKKTKQLKEADSFSRHLLARSLLAKLDYPHSTGHGIGLEVHEYPKIAKRSQDILKPNQVFTIEPGVYFEGKWGMRVEDSIYIDNNLQPHVLTKFSKQLLSLTIPNF